MAVAPDGTRTALATADGGRQWVPEAAVALEFNGLAYAVMMATPENLADFVAGFALSEGLIADADALTDLGIAEVEHGWVVRATLSGPGAEPGIERLAERVRARVAESSCGLCGIENLAEVARPLPRV
ncbi:MAG: formate dehydrogenase accessory sulfurtransferase FdhD, partial [Pseudomonadota bacterium]